MTSVVRHTMTRPRSSSASPTVAVTAGPGSVPTRWFGTMSAVSPNQKRDNPHARPPRQATALVWHGRRQDDIERADAVRRDQQQAPVVDPVEVAHLSRPEIALRQHRPSPAADPTGRPA